GGIPMSQGEIVRPADVGLAADAVAARLAGPLQAFASGNVKRRARLIELMRAQHEGTVGDCGLDETLATIRDEMHKFADSEGAAMASHQQLHPARRPHADVAAGCVRAHDPARVWRSWTR